TQCQDDEFCSNGNCQCRPGLTSCNGNCTDLLNDRDHCGACNSPCGNNDVCVDGVCQMITCQSIGQQTCDGACLSQFELQNNPLDCGQCGNNCGNNEVCANGNCRGYFAPPGCNACPCPQCGVGTTCCSFPGANFPICVNGATCPQ